MSAPSTPLPASDPGPGAVARVATPRSKYSEIWVGSNINIGRWYPDSESWVVGSARHDHPDGCDWWELRKRGTVTLLTGTDAEAYEAGWDAAVAAAALAVQELEGEGR